MKCRSCEAGNPQDARFCCQCGAPLTGNSGERRHLTVLFCDIVASTELARSLDPEELNDLTRCYYGLCSAAIQRYEGVIANYMGDGVMALFGYPRAHEDDAERAVHAARAIVRAVEPVGTDRTGRLQVRIGISTGLVVVGEDGSHAMTKEKTVVGEAPNEAAHLQAVAEPGTAVISASTRLLVANAFELKEVQRLGTKGAGERSSAWQVLGTRTSASRFAARTGPLTPLVGRDAELTCMTERWRLSQQAGQALALVGEAGIGKSRVVEAFRQAIAAEPHQTLHFQCSPHHVDSALYPVIAHLEREAGIAADDDTRVRIGKLEALLLTRGEDLDTAVPLICALLAVPNGEGRAAAEPDPQRRKERTLELLLAQTARLAHRHPLLIIVEDIHWADPTSLDLLGRLLQNIGRLRTLLVLTHRNEFSPAWSGPVQPETLRLARLGLPHCRAMVQSLAARKVVPAELVAQIVAKTDGVPLFVEELTKMVLESGLLRESDDAWIPLQPIHDLAIPATLRDSLLARLDRWPLAKEVAQVGAAIGREFSHELLLAVSPLRSADLESALGHLATAELIQVHGAPESISYIFKHALVQDAAYDTLLRSRRQQLHSRIAQVLEERFPEVAHAQPALLAHHLTQAGLADAAVTWWERAGDQAIRRSANLEAVRHFVRALDMLGPDEQAPGKAARELDIRIKLSGPLIATGGYVTPALADNYARAALLCERLGREEAAFPVMYGQWVVPYVRGDMATALRNSHEFLVRAQRQQDDGLLMMGHRIYGSSLVWSGDPAPGSEHLLRALELYRAPEHDRLAYVFSQHPRVAALSHLCLAQQHMGQADQAMASGWLAISEAKRIEHFNSIAYALCFVSLMIMLRRDVATLRRTAGELLELAERHKASYWTLWARPMLGWVAAQDGHIEQGIREMHECTEQLRQQGANLWVPQILLLEAEILGSAGQHGRAHELLDAAQALIEPLDQRFYEAELHRVRAIVLLAQGGGKAGLACLEQAIAVARRQRSRFLELRSCISKARYVRSQGSRENARAALAPALQAFSEGLCTVDLLDGRALLDELS